MMCNMFAILAGFTAPINIGTNPAAMLWMFPLLAAIAIVYKATRMTVIFPLKFIREVAILFATMSILMILAGVGIFLLVMILTG